MTSHVATYLGRDYGSHLAQHHEWLERCGYGVEDDRAQAAEDDLRRDLEHERRGGVHHDLFA